MVQAAVTPTSAQRWQPWQPAATLQPSLMVAGSICNDSAMEALSWYTQLVLWCQIYLHGCRSGYHYLSGPLYVSTSRTSLTKCAQTNKHILIVLFCDQPCLAQLVQPLV